MNKINYIFCENPYKKMWDSFLFFENEPSVKNFLLSQYSNKGYKEKNKFAFENTTKFIYFIKQAKQYFFSASKSNILVKPLLTYYGMMSLIKALILTDDPNYPNKTGVLQHGITTRKLKKFNYRFIDDEVKAQKEGLLPIFYKLITNSSLVEGTKFKISDLISLIPELHDCYSRLYNKKTIFQMHKNIHNSDYFIEFNISRDVLTLFDNSVDKFLFTLNNYSKQENMLFFIKEENHLDNLLLIWKDNKRNLCIYENFFNNPLIIQDYKGNYYFRYLDNSLPFLPEIINEFMIMYNLGILCRYDTELWGEIVFSFSSKDIYIINEFINLAIRKFPNLILNNFYNEYIIFKGY